MKTNIEKIIICSYDEKLLPEKKTDGSVCRDLRLAEDYIIAPGGLVVVATGIKTYLPDLWHAKIYARGGLPVKKGLILANSVGIVDSDYRGEYFLQLYNIGSETQELKKYMRVGQVEFCPHYDGFKGLVHNKILGIDMKQDAELYASFEENYSSERGEGKFHSTGIE